ncbi:hypothetical protein BDD43_2524 [Mucilaginibacter gracilis]|uniref:GLPGLI family protein n=1 Tax=Mucilaginibacter gracilis TaxID=423350 RepID=A0A495J1Y8_9SPHI|nr:hypothetical protein [Mucilaginibacter gracilis]RKR82348.1 hypothetical protein BDD43_2524 [Mucilaginibacter gracilis]
MRSFIITICLSFCSLLLAAQSFEGTIVYHNNYKSKLPNVTDEKFSEMMGSTQNYSVKDGNYKSTTNGTLLQWQLYNKSDKKLYTKVSSSAAILWNDATVYADTVLSTEINKGVAEILGYKCDELILHCKSGTQKYYFNTKISADSKQYIGHAYGNWYTVISKTNAIPLKIIMDTNQFSFESTATAVKAAKLDNTLFQLPAGALTVKSPY